MQLIFVVPEIGFLLVAAPFLIISHKGPLWCSRLDVGALIYMVSISRIPR